MIIHFLSSYDLKPQTFLIATSNTYIKMIMMYRLFTFQKLRGHSKTTWTKRGTKVPGTSVGGISIFVHVFVKKCLVWVVNKDPKYCSRRF